MHQAATAVLNPAFLPALEERLLSHLRNNQAHEFDCSLTEAHCYPLAAGGKRVRPLFLYLMASCFGTSLPSAQALLLELCLDASVAIEYVHTYSLVHDDLPCLDNDSLRRGQPTTHMIYGEDLALLVGDGLLTEAFLVLTSLADKNDSLPFSDRCVLSHLLSRTLAKAAGSSGMVRGQWLDVAATPVTLSQPTTGSLELQTRPLFAATAASLKENASRRWDFVQTVHRHKTGRLLAAALEMGFYCGVAAQEPSFLSTANCSHLGAIAGKIGEDLGLSFQITDDILDATQPSSTLGKSAGKDAAQEKFTAVSCLGIEKAREENKKVTNGALNLLHELLTLTPTAGLKISTPAVESLQTFVRQLLQRQT